VPYEKLTDLQWVCLLSVQEGRGLIRVPAFFCYRARAISIGMGGRMYKVRLLVLAAMLAAAMLLTSAVPASVQEEG
jgi:hypothetical protein